MFVPNSQFALPSVLGRRVNLISPDAKAEPVNYLRCISCGQRFCAGAIRADPFAECALCGGRLRATASTRPTDLPPADEDPAIPLILPALSSADPGSYPQGRASFQSLGEFARLERTRILSRERDFGLHWHDGSALYRAAWIEDTEELYIVQLGPSSAGGGHVEVLAVAGLEQLEHALAGWVDVVDEPGSLRWLRDRARRHLRAVPPAAVGRDATALDRA